MLRYTFCNAEPLETTSQDFVRTARLSPAGAYKQSRRKYARGTASVELLLCIIPFFLTFFAILQMSLLYIGQLVVQHAATRAVRSAIVVLDDDPAFYGGTPRGLLMGGFAQPESEDHATERSARPNSGSDSPALSVLRDVSPPQNEGGSGTHREQAEGILSAFNRGSHSSPRLSKVRRAAYVPLSILAPKPNVVNLSAPPLGGLTRIAFGLGVYGPGATAVTLHQGPDKREASILVTPHDQVTARIAYLMPCRVPLVAGLICQSGDELRADSRFSQLKKNVESKLTLETLLHSGSYFLILEAFASGPNHGAAYYPKEDS